MLSVSFPASSFSCAKYFISMFLVVLVLFKMAFTSIFSAGELAFMSACLFSRGMVLMICFSSSCLGQCCSSSTALMMVGKNVGS